MSDDRRAAAILLLLLVAGLVLRLVAGGGGTPGAVGFRAGGSSRPTRDSVATQAARLARPLGRGEKIDLDGADARELTRLPRIGPALAARIVADRERQGPFGSLEGLERVAGIGPATLDALRPHASFSGQVRHRRSSGLAAPAAAPAAPAAGGVGSGRAKVSLNTATARELAQLPGVGPARAQAIVDDRRTRGPFLRIEDLTRVRGIGMGTVERLRGWVGVP